MHILKPYLIAITVFCTICACILIQGHFFQETKLTILHFNDLHSRFTPTFYKDGADCEHRTDCIGGIARLKTVIERERASSENTLLLSAGDNYQGSIFFSLFKEKALVEVLNELNIDAMGLGNHEFDEGSRSLARFVDEAEFPILAGNVLFASTSPLSKKLMPYKIVEFEGKSVGIISSVTAKTPELSSPETDITFIDEYEYLSTVAGELEGMGVNIIIAITHVGYDTDVQLAQTVPFVDVIVGGHSDTLLSNTQEDAEGPYPTVIEKKNGQQTLVVQTRPYGAQLGKLEVAFDTKGEVASYQGEPIIVGSDIEPDPVLAEKVQKFQAQISSLESSVIAMIDAPINGNPDQCRDDDCGLGKLVADALISHSQNRFGATIALLNSGSIRSSLNAGEVAKSDLVTALPFNNSISYANVSGLTLKQMMEKSVAKIGERSGGFLQVGGLSVSFDPSREEGSQICSLLETASGREIDPESMYRIATNDYLAMGGDGYAPLSDVETSSSTLYTALEEYFLINQYYRSALDDRINTHCYE